MLRAMEDMTTFLPIHIIQLDYYHHMPLSAMDNGEMSIHAPMLLASSNTAVIMFDFEPFNSVIMTYYFCVFYHL